MATVAQASRQVSSLDAAADLAASADVLAEKIRPDKCLIKFTLAKQRSKRTMIQSDVLETLWDYVRVLHKQKKTAPQIQDQVQTEFGFQIKEWELREKMKECGRRNIPTKKMRRIAAITKCLRQDSGRRLRLYCLGHGPESMDRRLQRHIKDHGEPAQCDAAANISDFRLSLSNLTVTERFPTLDDRDQLVNQGEWIGVPRLSDLVRRDESIISDLSQALTDRTSRGSAVNDPAVIRQPIWPHVGVGYHGAYDEDGTGVILNEPAITDEAVETAFRIENVGAYIAEVTDRLSPPPRLFSALDVDATQGRIDDLSEAMLAYLDGVDGSEPWYRPLVD